MKTGHWFAGSVGAACLVGAILFASNTGRGIAQDSGAMTLNCDNRPCDTVAHGRKAFNDRRLRDLGGNGRACADCHMPSEAFQLSPAAARARFEALMAKRAPRQKADDPLFRPIDADDFREKGAQANDYSNLVENGLVRVTMPLPANVVLIDPATGQPSSETLADVWRAVIPVFNVAMTVRTVSCRSGRRVLHGSRSWDRIPTARIGRGAINTTPGSGRCRSRRGRRSCLTQR